MNDQLVRPGVKLRGVAGVRNLRWSSAGFDLRLQHLFRRGRLLRWGTCLHNPGKQSAFPLLTGSFLRIANATSVFEGGTGIASCWRGL